MLIHSSNWLMCIQVFMHGWPREGHGGGGQGEGEDYNYMNTKNAPRSVFVEVSWFFDIHLMLLCYKILLYFAMTGCGKLFSIDGNWKLSYPICMYRVPKEISGFKGALKYVDSCPNQPASGMAFCQDHCSVARADNIPCPLWEFLQHVGVNHGNY